MTDELPDAPWATGGADLPEAPWAKAGQSTGLLAKAAEPITSYPETYQQMNREARERVAHGFQQLTGEQPRWDPVKDAGQPDASWWTKVKGAANVGFGSLEYVTSPIQAGLRTVVGKPFEENLGIPKEYSEFAGGLSLPGYGLTRLRVPSIPREIPKLPPEPVGPLGRENAEKAGEFGIKLSQGQATRDLDAIRFEDMAARGAHGKPAQEVAAPFFDDQFQAVQGGARDVGQGLAGEGRPIVEAPGQAGAVINAELGEQGNRARQIVTQAEAQARAEAEASRGMVEDQGRALTSAIEGGHLPIESPREAGELVGHAVRERAAAARAGFRERYNEAFGLEGQFHAGAFEGVGNRIKGQLSLGENPVIVDDVTTPVASRAVRDLDNISGLRIQNRADPFGAPDPSNIVAVDLRGVDQARKRLVAYYQAARSSNNASDVRAVGRIIDEFDAQVEHSIANGLFSGDPRALQALQEARAAYSRYARTFRPQQAGDDVGQAIRRITDRNATPEEIANMVVGSGRLGNAGLPVRLADRLQTILGADSDAWSAVRQAVWQRASNVRTAAGGIDPVRTAQSVADFAGSSLAQRVFSAQERAAMRAHAQGLRDLDATVAQLPTTRAAERAQNAYQRIFGGEGIGGAQATTFRRIIEGTATPEETAQAVFGAIGSGNPGNVSRMLSAIERISGRDSDTMAAIRQGVWQKLTQNAAGKDQPGQQKIAQAINEFLNGKGSSIARQLYTADELGTMKRYADAIKLTVIPKYARTNSDTAPALLAAVGRYSHSVASALGIGHGPVGRAVGYGVGKLIGKGAEKLGESRSAGNVQRHFDWQERKRGGRVKKNSFASGGAPDIPEIDPITGLSQQESKEAAQGWSNAASTLGTFASKGLSGVMQEKGVELPQWSNRLGNFLQSEDVNAALGIFGGPLAKTADLAALARAKALTGQNAPPHQIWNETGWFQGVDGKWRFEIPDNASQFHGLNPEPQSTAIRAAMQHPEFFEAYPDAKRMTAEEKSFGIGNLERGQYISGLGVDDPSIHLAWSAPDKRSVMLHEMQHAVQEKEGFARGSNTYGLRPGTPAWDIYQERLQAIRTPISREEFSQRAGYDGMAPEKDYRAYLKTTRNIPSYVDRAAQEYAVREAYNRSAGEVEARNVQTRMDMPPEQRRAAPPWTTEDVPREQQFILQRELRARGGRVATRKMRVNAVLERHGVKPL